MELCAIDRNINSIPWKVIKGIDKFGTENDLISIGKSFVLIFYENNIIYAKSARNNLFKIA